VENVLSMPPLMRGYVVSPYVLPRGPKDLKNDMGSVKFSKHLAGTPPPPYPPKRDMLDQVM